MLANFLRLILLTFSAVILFIGGQQIFSGNWKQGPNTAYAAVNGLGATFQSGFSTNLSATIYNDEGSAFSEGQQIPAEFGVFQCSNAGSDPCAPDLAPSEILSSNISPVTINAPPQGSSSQMSFSIPGFSCGRVQVDLGLPSGGGIVGGTVYNLGTSCAGPEPTPAPTPAPTPVPTPPVCPELETPTGLNWNLSTKTVSWNAVPGAVGYHVRLVNPSGVQTNYDGIAGTSYRFPDSDVSQVGDYSWWVDAVNNCGSVSRAGAFFTINPPPPLACPAPGEPGTQQLADCNNQWAYDQCTVTSRDSRGNPTSYHCTWSGNDACQGDLICTPPSVEDLVATCAANPSTAAIGQTVTWTASVTGGQSPYSYSWGGTVSGDTPSATESYTTSGRKMAFVDVTDALGDSDRSLACYVDITEEPIPSCTLTASPQTITSGSATTLTAQYQSGGSPRSPTSYTFNFADSSPAISISSNSISHNYSVLDSDQTFTPSVSLFDSSGLITTCASSVLVLSQGEDQPNVTITKSTSTPSINAGQQATFTVSIHNNSGRSLSNVTVTDNLPNGFSYVSGSTFGSTSSDPSVSGNNLTWSNISLPDNGDWSITFRANSPTVSGSYTNLAQVSAEGLNFGPAGVTVAVTDEDLPGLTLDKVAVFGGIEYQNLPSVIKRFTAGETINYRIKITNNSSTTARNVVASDDLPLYLSVGSGGGGVVSGKSITWSLGTISPGNTQTLDYTAIVLTDIPAGETSQINSAKVTATDVSQLTDSASVIIFRQPAEGEPVLSVEKTPSTQTVSPGAQATFTVRVRNSSGRNVSSIQVIDDLPSGFTYVAGSASGSTSTDPSISGTTLTWSNILIADSQDWSVTFRATAPQTAGTYTNQARAVAESKNFGPAQAIVIVSSPPVGGPGPGGGNSSTNTNTNTSSSQSSSSSSSSNSNTNTVSISNPSPTVILARAASAGEVKGVSGEAKILPKTGQDVFTWSVLPFSLITLGLRMVNFGKIKEMLGNNPYYIAIGKKYRTYFGEDA